MEILVIGGAAAILLYNSFYKPPQPEDGNKDGNALPAPRFLYSDPAIWTSSPVDISYRSFKPYFGPNNDPRRAYLLYGGSRVPHSGYNPVVQTNQVWPATSPKDPSATPGYTADPVTAIGEKQRINSKTVFTQ